MSARRLAVLAALVSVHVATPSSLAAPPLASDVADVGSADERLWTRDHWLLAAEGALNAPVDAGVRATLDTPYRLRAYAGYGWVPTATFSNVASAMASDPRAHAILDETDFTGTVWRLGAGVRPWRELGFYLDGGFAHANLDASLLLAATDLPELRLVGGEASMSTRLDLWSFELGYQAQFLERLMLAGGVGAMGTIDSSTSVAATSGLAREVMSDVADDVDEALRSYSFVPTLSLRLGIDLI